MASRTWIKIYCDNWLEGTISEESLALRGIWIGLLALAGSGKHGDTGLVMAINGVGFSDSMLAAMLKVTRQRWVYAKKTLQKTDRIAVDKANVITIINWQKYQSEYKRQKPYRNQKLQPKVTPKVTREKEKEIEKKKKNNNDHFDTSMVICSDSLKEIISYYFKAYREYTGEPHPNLKPEQLKRVVKVLENLQGIEALYQEHQRVIDYHFQRELKTDYNINHFATEGILENLYYKKLYYE